MCQQFCFITLVKVTVDETFESSLIVELFSHLSDYRGSHSSSATVHSIQRTYFGTSQVLKSSSTKRLLDSVHSHKGDTGQIMIGMPFEHLNATAV
jgi:hypothetical protein